MGVKQGTTVQFTVEDGVGTLLLAREPVNALDVRTQDLMRQVAEEASTREDVRAVVLRGAGGRFCAGADIREMAGMSHPEMRERAPLLQLAFRAVAEIGKPVVAAIEGFALGGGCELALAADRRVIADDAVIGLPEIHLGVIPGAGGTQRLPRLVGTAVAKEMIYSGRALSALEALEVGLVDEVVPANAVVDTATAWAARFVSGPALALRAAKRAIDGGADRELPGALEWETALFADLFATRDRDAGMRGFVENGPGRAEFQGR